MRPWSARTFCGSRSCTRTAGSTWIQTWSASAPSTTSSKARQFVGVSHKQGRITNTAIAAIPGHPLLDRAMHEIKPLEAYWTGSSDVLKDVAGPRLLQKLLPEFPDIVLLEPYMFFPSNAEDRKRAIAVHHMARVWHNTTTLRAAMLRAERRLEKVREQPRARAARARGDEEEARETAGSRCLGRRAERPAGRRRRRLRACPQAAQEERLAAAAELSLAQRSVKATRGGVRSVLPAASMARTAKT